MLRMGSDPWCPAVVASSCRDSPSVAARASASSPPSASHSVTVILGRALRPLWVDYNLTRHMPTAHHGHGMLASRKSGEPTVVTM